MTLFSIITGSESLSYQNVVSFLEVECYLEPLEDILIENLHLEKGSTPEKSRLSTFGMYQHLKAGQPNIVHSFFVDERFININSIEYQTLRAARQQLLSRNFFINSVVEANSMISFIKDEDLEKMEDAAAAQAKKQRVEYKLLALATLYSAIDIHNDFNTGTTSLSDFESEKELDLHITKKINEVTDISALHEDSINRAFFFKIIRKSYLRLNQYLR